MPVTRREQKEKLEEGKDPSVVIAKNIGDTREKCCEVKWYPLNWKKSTQNGKSEQLENLNLRTKKSLGNTKCVQKWKA